MGYQEVRSHQDVTIANGGNLSSAVDLTGQILLCIQTPAAWTAAVITLQGSADGDTYANLWHPLTGEVSLAAAASRIFALEPAMFLGIRYLKIRSGTSGTPVNQGAARTIMIVMYPSA